MATLEEKRRMVRRLFGTTGRGFAETLGFRVTSSPSSLFQLLCLSILLHRVRDYGSAARAARALRDHGWDSAARMAASSTEERSRVLQENGGDRRAQELAATLGDLAKTVVQRYAGDLRRLRTQARQDAGRERKLLRDLPGVDEAVADLFFREAQAVWREIAPFADRRALGAASKLGLGRSAAELSEITGGVESEKIAWLVGALVRVDLDKRYDEVREYARR